VVRAWQCFAVTEVYAPGSSMNGRGGCGTLNRRDFWRCGSLHRQSLSDRPRRRAVQLRSGSRDGFVLWYERLEAGVFKLPCMTLVLLLFLGNPGALPPTEVISAHKAGADFVKVFPCAPAVSSFVPE